MIQNGTQPSEFKAAVVQLILENRTEGALKLLADEYGVDIPSIKVGLPKGHVRKAYGTYNAKTHTICVLDREVFGNPFVIIHEFYHHLRTKGVDKLHRGTEKNADKFSVEFLKAYQLAAAKSRVDSL